MSDTEKTLNQLSSQTLSLHVQVLEKFISMYRFVFHTTDWLCSFFIERHGLLHL